jgi:hypothetical protein
MALGACVRSLSSLPFRIVSRDGKALVYGVGSISARFELHEEMEYSVGILE